MCASLSLMSDKMFRENWPDLEVLQSDTTQHCFNCNSKLYTHSFMATLQKMLSKFSLHNQQK